ncbi:hypothetical protein K443DRAFT_659148, partial [Laccaria amethystina LaAM-08-1]
DLYSNDETDFNEQAQEETPAEPGRIGSPSTTTATSTTTTTKAADTKLLVKPPQVIPTENGACTGNNTTSLQQQQRYTQPVQTPDQLHPTSTPKNPDAQLRYEQSHSRSIVSALLHEYMGDT